MNKKSFIKYGEEPITDSTLRQRVSVLRQTIEVLEQRIEIINEISELKANSINVLKAHLNLVQKDLQKEKNRVFVFRPRLWFKKKKNV